MKSINQTVLPQGDRLLHEHMLRQPIHILQIGEGNFLRGFFDWMIQQCRNQGLFDGAVAVTQPRPSGKAKIDKLAEQDGLYTLVVRGLANGERMERREIVQVFAKAFDPYSIWNDFLALAVSPDLKIVVSNTTEAGLAYRPEVLRDNTAVESFPGKMAQLLYHRYVSFQGAADRGLVFLPCELLEHNGDTLRECVLRYADDWNYPPEFRQWVLEHNRFLNSLVDRIVTGYPGDEQAEQWFQEWGYRDHLLCTAEPYHLWAIQAEPEMERLLPLQRAGLNVHWVSDLKPFQQRKVRILNGAHTLMTPLGLLYDVEHVRELMEHPHLGAFVRDAVEQEIIPTLPYSAEEMKSYAQEVFERFRNPFIRHRLSDIAMNSLSKFKVRLLPSLAYYAEQGLPLPGRLVRGFASLLRYYRVKKDGDHYVGVSLKKAPYVVRDDARLLDIIAGIWADADNELWSIEKSVGCLLANKELWGKDLSAWNGLQKAVVAELTQLERVEI